MLLHKFISFLKLIINRNTLVLLYLIITTTNMHFRNRHLLEPSAILLYLNVFVIYVVGPFFRFITFTISKVKLRIKHINAFKSTTGEVLKCQSKKVLIDAYHLHAK